MVKKLGKKNNIAVLSVEAYACNCSDCSCRPVSCSCDGGSAFSSSYSGNQGSVSSGISSGLSRSSNYQK